MYYVIEKLHQVKDYKIETLFTAMNLADRYLAELAESQTKAPCLVALGVTTLLMAAKIEEPISPSFERMVGLLKKYDITNISKRILLDQEEQVILKLDFHLRDVSSIQFLERYLRLFGIDTRSKDQLREVVLLAYRLCTHQLGKAQFLSFKPSQQAAASTLLAINICLSPTAKVTPLKCMNKDRLQS